MTEVRVWIDLANSPHVPLAEPILRSLRERGDEVVLTARDHAQTVELASKRWPELSVVGGSSPAGRTKKALAIAGRAVALRRVARAERPDVAFSHGSYAQVLAARSAGVPSLVMMDYEHQPANHISFRLAQRVIVPHPFPDAPGSNGHAWRPHHAERGWQRQPAAYIASNGLTLPAAYDSPDGHTPPPALQRADRLQ